MFAIVSLWIITNKGAGRRRNDVAIYIHIKKDPRADERASDYLLRRAHSYKKVRPSAREDTKICSPRANSRLFLMRLAALAASFIRARTLMFERPFKYAPRASERARRDSHGSKNKSAMQNSAPLSQINKNLKLIVIVTPHFKIYITYFRRFLLLFWM